MVCNQRLGWVQFCVEPLVTWQWLYVLAIHNYTKSLERTVWLFLEDVKVIYEKKLTQRFVWLKKPCQYKETIQISGPVI